MMEERGKGPNNGKSVADWMRTVRGIKGQIDDPEAVAQALRIYNEMHDQIQEAILALHEEGYSWTELAKPAGVSRQAMRQRWGQRL